MSVVLPEGCYLQPNDVREKAGSSEKRLYEVLGPYSGLSAIANADEACMALGLNVQDIASVKLERLNGNMGRLTVETAKGDETLAVSAIASVVKTTWSLRTCRNDVSLYCYCGSSAGAGVSRAQLEAWQKEPDGELAKLYQYKDSSGQTVQLSGPTLDVAEKIAKGVDAVMRFYIILTRKKTYSAPPATLLEHLGEVDTPPLNGIGSQAVHAELQMTCDWLKVQDDLDEDSEGRWNRTESWMGIPVKDGNEQAWDRDLYGPIGTRWPVPYNGSNS